MMWKGSHGRWKGSGQNKVSPQLATTIDFILTVVRSGKTTGAPGAPSAEQPSVLVGWLDFSIHHFRSELWRLSLET